MDTLVLDASYTPVNRISWQRALVLLWEQKVEVLEEYEDRTVRSVSLEFRVPSVIRFFTTICNKGRSVRFSKENVFLRDSGKCQYCGTKLSRAKSTFDHVIPRALGGSTRWNNVVICCYSCNQRKGCRTPEQARMRLLSKPTKPKSLPLTFFLTFSAQRSAPKSWKAWLGGATDWNEESELADA